MIKDIGTEGLRLVDITPPNHAYDAFNKGSVIVLPEGVNMDMIDVTTREDTGRVYMQCYTQSTGPM
jgi:hypothetical protein